MTQYI